MPWNKTDYGFKVLRGRRPTDSINKHFYNEWTDCTLDIHALEVKAAPIPADPSNLSDPNIGNIQSYTNSPLVWNESVPNYQSWFATTDQTLYPSQTDDSSRLKNWVSPKYDGRNTSLVYVGTTVSYTVLLYTRQSSLDPWQQVAESDVSDWIFNYQTGELNLNGTSTTYGAIDSNTQFSISGYRYVGAVGVGVGSVTSVGGTAGVKTTLGGGAAITSSGSLELDLSYSPTWTGNHTFNGQVLLGNTGSINGAPLRFSASASAPTSQLVGQMWWDGTHLYFATSGSSQVDLLNSVTIGNLVNGGSDNAVLYTNASGDLEEDASHFGYDDVGKQFSLGVGISGASALLTVKATVTSQKAMVLYGQSSATASILEWGLGGTLLGKIDSSGNIDLSPANGQYGLRFGNLALANFPSAAAGNIGAVLWDTTDGELCVSNGTSWLQLSAIPIGSGAVSGTGTPNTLAIWTSSSVLGNSLITQSGTMVTIAGDFSANTKSFRIDHPTDPDAYLVYGVLEGPEHGVYHRGRVKGWSPFRVTLPEYWHALVEQGYTISITPRGRYALFCYDDDANGFSVDRISDEFSRSEPIEFDYLVVGSRVDAPLVTKQAK